MIRMLDSTRALFLLLPLLHQVLSQDPLVRYDCDPCINRSTFTIKAIVHGTKDDPFWQQIQASSVQAAKDMDVNLEMKLYDKYDTDRMAQDIVSVVNLDEKSRPDGLIVSIPSEDVAGAVQQAIESGIPTFGINSGAAVGQAMGVVDFISSDNYQGGVFAAQEMLRLGASDNFLFVDYRGGQNVAFEERWLGFKETIEATASGTSPLIGSLAVDANSDDSAAIQSKLVEQMTATCCTCPAILLSDKNILPEAIAAYAEAGCSQTTSPLGTFETSQAVYDALSSEQLSFTIGEQQALQGSLAVVLASLYVSTGKSLSASSEATDGEYMTGPLLIRKGEMTDTQKGCEVDAFPVCPNTKAPDGGEARCGCTDRSSLKIGGVTHGVSTDSFWDPVYAASKQAAFDMGVQLFNDVFDPEEDEAVLHTKMANRITQLCEQEQVDGLFVSIPSDTVVPAIEKCLGLGIPILSINAGVDFAKNMSLPHHIGMLEEEAGYKAGRELLQSDGIERAVCINHAEGVNVVEERCAGFKRAIDEDASVEWIGQAYVPGDNQDQYITKVEELVGDTGTWAGIGILAAGGPQHGPVLALQQRHPDATIGAFDVSLDLYDAVDQGFKEFGLDQEAYLQGYMPVVLLTYAAKGSTGQQLLNTVIESGPRFITSSPSETQQVCEDSLFGTCAAEEEDQQSSATSSRDPNRGLVIGLSVVAVVFFLALVFVMYRMKRLNDHIAALERGGTSVPRLSVSQRLSSTVMAVADIVKASKAEAA